MHTLSLTLALSSAKGLQTGLLERNGLQAALWQMFILPTSVKKGLLLPTLLLSDLQLQTVLPSYHPSIAGRQPSRGWWTGASAPARVLTIGGRACPNNKESSRGQHFRNLCGQSQLLLLAREDSSLGCSTRARPYPAATLAGLGLDMCQERSVVVTSTCSTCQQIQQMRGSR